MPHGIVLIYDETYKALGNKQPILAGIGLRTLLEAVCNERKARGKTLEKKIDDLIVQGSLTKQSASILHYIRHLGNFSAHEVEANSWGELSTALDIAGHLLNELYILPKHAKLFIKLPKERKTKP